MFCFVLRVRVFVPNTSIVKLGYIHVYILLLHVRSVHSRAFFSRTGSKFVSQKIRVSFLEILNSYKRYCNEKHALQKRFLFSHKVDLQ